MQNTSACLAPVSSNQENRRKLISIVLPTYNEALNVGELYTQIIQSFKDNSKYDLEMLFIDNASTDQTVDELRKLASMDSRIKIIINSRNFGPIRSHMHGMFQASGDCVIAMATDLQDPPSLIPKFIQKWEEGFPLVLAIKEKVDENFIIYHTRKFYYNFIAKIAEIHMVKNFTGFGLYDRRLVEILREMKDPYPYFRGLISEMGFAYAALYFHKPARKKGITSMNFYSLYDTAMLGITNHSKVPLRIATFTGFVLAVFNLLLAIGYFIAKLIFWYTFTIGLAPLIIGMFFFASVQLFFIGILGEYIGFIYTQVQKRPLVVEKERVNFNEPARKAHGRR